MGDVFVEQDGRRVFVASLDRPFPSHHWAEELLGETLATRDGPQVTADALALRTEKKRLVILCFANKRNRVNPNFNRFYSELTAASVAVLLISDDEDEKGFQETLAGVLFPAMAFERDRVALFRQFKKTSDGSWTPGIHSEANRLAFLHGMTGEQLYMGVNPVKDLQKLSWNHPITDEPESLKGPIWDYPTAESITKDEAEFVADEIAINLKEKDSAKEQILQVFHAWDQDGDGTISVDELTGILTDLGSEHSEDELRVMFQAIDKSKDGRLDFEEFVDWIYCAGEEDFSREPQRGGEDDEEGEEGEEERWHGDEECENN